MMSFKDKAKAFGMDVMAMAREHPKKALALLALGYLLNALQGWVGY